MGNRFKGEISVEHEGQRYTLRLDFNAMCDFEDMTGHNAMAATAEFEEGTIRFSDMRTLVFVALKQEHPDADVSLAGAILSNDMDVLARLLLAAFPEPTASTGSAAGNAKAGRPAA